MSYFDGIIPQVCRGCFTWDGQKWVQTVPGLCDECDHMLEIFPMIGTNKESEHKKWELLSIMAEPAWIMPEDKGR